MSDGALVNSRVLVGVITHNSAADILGCLQSIMDQSLSPEGVLVVDNHSHDETILLVRTHFPQCRILECASNDGFATAANRALQYAEAHHFPYLWLMNPDAVAAPDALKQLVRVAIETPQGALFSPRIIDSAGQPWFVEGSIHWWRQRAVHKQTVSLETRMVHDTYLTGCALFMKVSLVLAVGGFDQRFFLYYEDADLSLRVREAGHTLSLVPQALVRHEERSAENPRKVYHLVRSALLFFYKWRSRGAGSAYFFVYAILRRLNNYLYFCVLGGETRRMVMYAHRDAWQLIRSKNECSLC